MQAYPPQTKRGEEIKYCHNLYNQQQKYHLARNCANNNNTLLNFLSFVISGFITAVVLNYRLLGFEPWNLV